MNKLKKIVKRALLTLLLISISSALIIIGLGYREYKRVTGEMSYQEKIASIQTDHYVSLDLISEEFINSVVAVEDRRFWNRSGLDFIALGRSILYNLKTQSLSQGGSTIPQQVAKTLYFDYDNDLIEKVAQVFIMYDLEDLYEKEELLEFYLNIIYYGDGYTGVLAASNGYYGLSPAQLDYAKGSLLAGIIQAPSAYALSNHFDLAKERQVAVLNALVRSGYLTQQQGEAIYQESIEVKKK